MAAPISLSRALLAATLLVVAARATIIAPPWANSSLNPCAPTSWQLLHWPADGRCYRIFERGPCGSRMELVWRHVDASAGRAACQCADGHVRHTASGQCHRLHGRRPCAARHFLDETGTCRPHEHCLPGQLFYPPAGTCHRPLTQGPCAAGRLITATAAAIVAHDRHTAQCRCDAAASMRRHYYRPFDGCYELGTRGPCARGLIFSSGDGGGGCRCTAGMRTYYDGPSRQCFEPGTRGPCPVGNMFHVGALNTTLPLHTATTAAATVSASELAVSSVRCSCRPNTVRWPVTGACYTPFTRAVCSHGQFLAPVYAPPPPPPLQQPTADAGAADEQPNTQLEEYGVCVTSPCRPGELYFPEDRHCHTVGTRGSCPLGQLVQYDNTAAAAGGGGGGGSGGVSFRGHCGCTADYTRNYWPPHAACYQLYTRGPCAAGRRLVYDGLHSRPQCACDPTSGLIAQPPPTTVRSDDAVNANCTVHCNQAVNSSYHLQDDQYDTQPECHCRSPLARFSVQLGRCVIPPPPPPPTTTSTQRRPPTQKLAAKSADALANYLSLRQRYTARRRQSHNYNMLS